MSRLSVQSGEGNNFLDYYWQKLLFFLLYFRMLGGRHLAAVVFQLGLHSKRNEM